MIDLSQLAVLTAGNLSRLTCLTRITTRDLEALISLGPGERFGSNGLAIAVAFHPTRPLLAVGYGDGAVRLWDCTKGTWLYETEPLHVNRNNRIESLAFSPGGEFLAAYHYLSIGAQEVANIWWSEDGRMLAVHSDWTVDGGGWRELEGFEHRVAFAGNESLLVVTESSGPGYELSVRDLLTGEILRALTWLPGSPPPRVRRTGISPDGTLLAVKCGPPHAPPTSCTLWNVQQGIELGPLEDREHMTSTSQMTISPDKRWLAMTLRWSVFPGNKQVLAETGSLYPKYSSIGIWELATRCLVHTLTVTEPLPDGHDHLLFTPDSRLLIAPSRGLSAWQVETWRKLSGAEGVRMASGHSAMTASGDGKLLAFCDYGEVGVWGVPLATAEKQDLLVV